MKKSEIMFHAAQAAEVLDALKIADSTDGASYYGGMCHMLALLGGQFKFKDGKHAVSLFGYPFITADDKVVTL